MDANSESNSHIKGTILLNIHGVYWDVTLTVSLDCQGVVSCQVERSVTQLFIGLVPLQLRCRRHVILKTFAVPELTVLLSVVLQ